MKNMDPVMESKNSTSDLKACMNFKWTDDLTLRFVLYRHERRHLFTKKRNTSRHGWQQILHTMGLTAYVTPYQAQKKWNNLWSRYKVAKKAQTDGIASDEMNDGWPLFTVLDAIATGKNVSITYAAADVGEPDESIPSMESTKKSLETHLATDEHKETEEPSAKKCKITADHHVGQPLDSSTNEKHEIVTLLQANLNQMIEIKQAIEAQGKAVIHLLSQMLDVMYNRSKTANSSTSENCIDDAISATIREIGIPQENI